MRPLDWVVLSGTLAFIVLYGLYKGRGSNTISKYLLAGKTMPWYAMALSIMATQASAITFISTTGQGYVDGMRFVQFYFGLPIAMIVISSTSVRLFHRANVYTAYEYLEKRFDAKTRTLASIVFLMQRGLSVGVSLYAPAIVLSVILGWPDRLTTLGMGVLITIYTVTGGIKAVTWTDVQQMLIIFAGLFVAFFMIIHLLPPGISFTDAVYLAGAIGKLKAVDAKFDLANRYNLWSGLIGGTFLALSYFGCDQSQVQRYLTGKSIAQSKLSLLFTAMAKIPMQFFILFVGAMVFVFFIFVRPPLLFQPIAMRDLESSQVQPRYAPISAQFDRAFDERREAALGLVDARRAHDGGRRAQWLGQYRQAQARINQARAEGAGVVQQIHGEKEFNDTNYIFLSFVTRYLPAGVVGLVIAVIFAAAMSSSSGEVNSLATVTVIDIYRRHIRQDAPDRHYLWASRVSTAFWAAYAVFFAQYAKNLGSLVEAVNVVGSLFYGTLLGVFVLAFAFRRVTGTAAFIGMLAGESAILATALFTRITFLWFNVIGCAVVIVTGLLISWLRPVRQPVAA
ncbi:MAG: sodium:solute symporter [Acidobacteria bacterium]|nr:MAG: sodium:solute symporter [Acidobacteriota bacterium]